MEGLGGGLVWLIDDGFWELEIFSIEGEWRIDSSIAIDRSMNQMYF